MLIGSFLRVKGIVQFAEVELSILVIFLFAILLFSTGFALFLSGQQSFHGRSMFGVSFLLLVSFFNIIRFLYFGKRFDSLQERQEEYLLNQFFRLKSTQYPQPHDLWRKFRLG